MDAVDGGGKEIKQNPLAALCCAVYSHYLPQSHHLIITLCGCALHQLGRVLGWPLSEWLSVDDDGFCSLPSRHNHRHQQHFHILFAVACRRWKDAAPDVHLAQPVRLGMVMRRFWAVRISSQKRTVGNKETCSRFNWRKWVYTRKYGVWCWKDEFHYVVEQIFEGWLYFMNYLFRLASLRYGAWHGEICFIG